MNAFYKLKWIIKIIVICVCLCGSSAMLQAMTLSDRPKVAVVLSGGGAKGVAHISVLQMIEQMEIPIDYVVGTSMGAIIGGLYSIGYSPIQLDSLVRSQDWEWLLSDKPKHTYRTLTAQEEDSRYIISVPLSKRVSIKKPESFAKGQNIGDLLTALTIGYHDSISFARLPIPFACVATDITNGNEVTLDKGVLAEAMRASMAIPGIFSPVRKNGMILVDGGLVNNYPIDVARRMGADIIIGVDVQDGLKQADELNTLSEILTQIVDLVCTNKHEENKDMTDVYIKVNVEGYSASSFTSTAIDSLLHRGKDAALQSYCQLLNIKERLNNCTAKYPVHRIFSEKKKLYISDISFNGILPNDKRWIIRKCRLKENSYISQSQLEFALSILRNELNYSDVYFRLYANEKGYSLVFHLAEKNVTTLNFSARFDTEEVASLLLGSSFYLSGKVPSTLSLIGRLGKQYVANFNYTLHPSLMRDISMNYTYRYHDIDFYSQGNKLSNISYNFHTFDLGYSNLWLRNFRYQLGVAYEFYHNVNSLYRNNDYQTSNNWVDNIFNYYARLDYNTQDRGSFPTRGIRFSLLGSIYTDKIVNFHDCSSFYTLLGSFSGTYTFAHRLALLPSAYVRLLNGNSIPLIYRNTIGGENSSHYLRQQIPFMGVSHVEFANDVLVTCGLQLRYRIGKRHYLSMIGNIASNTDKFDNIWQDKFLYGIGINYSFDNHFVPLSMSLGYSNLTNKVYCFANIGYYF